MAYILSFSISPFAVYIFLPKAVIVQNKNNIVKELAIADMLFTITETCVTSLAKRVKILPIIINNGAPGACTTSNL